MLIESNSLNAQQNTTKKIDTLQLKFQQQQQQQQQQQLQEFLKNHHQQQQQQQQQQIMLQKQQLVDVETTNNIDQMLLANSSGYNSGPNSSGGSSSSSSSCSNSSRSSVTLENSSHNNTISDERRKSSQIEISHEGFIKNIPPNMLLDQYGMLGLSMMWQHGENTSELDKNISLIIGKGEQAKSVLKNSTDLIFNKSTASPPNSCTGNSNSTQTWVVVIFNSS